MTLDLEDLRLSIYTSLASTGRAPDTAALAVASGASAAEIESETHALMMVSC